MCLYLPARVCLVSSSIDYLLDILSCDSQKKGLEEILFILIY